MQTGSNSGDGRSSPFGGGPGGKGVGGGMAGNNFTTNPGGTPSGFRGPDLVNNSRSQVMAKPDHSTQDAAAGGLIPAAAPPANRPGGVGTIGNSAKPFRVGA